MDIIAGQLRVPVRLSGRRRFLTTEGLIDTGATFSVVSLYLSSYLELDIYQQRPWVDLITATDMVRAPVHLLEVIEVATLRIDSLPVVVLDLPIASDIQVILGMNLLERANLRVDGKGSSFEIWDP